MTTINIEQWGEVELIAGSHSPSLKQLPHRSLWIDDDHCWPVILRVFAPKFESAYVAVAPDDFDGPQEHLPDDLRGFILCQPTVLHCFACSGDFASLYPAAGLPFFSQQLKHHAMVRHCPECDVDFSTSRIFASRIDSTRYEKPVPRSTAPDAQS